jgi:hypothetical protein
MTVRAVMPNALGSARNAPRIVPPKVKAMEPIIQRSSVVIVDKSFIVENPARSRKPNE